MNRPRYLNWPLCGLLLYLMVLLGFGLVYARSQHRRPVMQLTGVTRLPQRNGMVELSIRGFGLDKKLRAHLVLDAANRRAIAGNLPIWGQAVDIEIVGDRAYVVSPEEGVKVFDLALPTEPEQLSGIRKRARYMRVNIDEENIYLSSMSRGLAVYGREGMDLRYKLDPVGGSFSSIHRGQRLYVASGKSGLSIFDISSKIDARLLGRLPLPGITSDLVFYKGYLLASSKTGGLHLVDIRNASHPRLLQTISAQKSYVKVAVVGDFVYVADQDLRLDIFRLSQAGTLVLQSSLSAFGSVRDFLQDGQRLYIAESSYGISVLDISDPAMPQRIGYVGTPGEPGGLALYGNYLYVASSSQGVQIIDTRRFTPRRLSAAIDTPGGTNDIALDGRWIYVADGDAGLQVIDRGDMENLKLVAHLPTRSRATHLVTARDMLYLAVKGRELLVVDVRNPLLPRLVSRLALPVDLSDLAIRDTTLFASSFSKKLLRIDISDAAHPRILESLDLPGKAWRIALVGDDVFIAAEKAGLQIARFLPGKPGRLIANLTRPWPMTAFAASLGIAVRDGYAYLVQGEEGLQIIDIGNPEKPREVGLVKIPGQSLDICLSKNFAVLSNRWNGYYFVDIRRPEHPFLAANIYHPRTKSGFKTEGDRLYATGRKNGVSVLPLPIPKTSILGSADLSLVFNEPLHPGWYDLSISDGKKLETVSAVMEVR